MKSHPSLKAAIATYQSADPKILVPEPEICITFLDAGAALEVPTLSYASPKVARLRKMCVHKIHRYEPGNRVYYIGNGWTSPCGQKVDCGQQGTVIQFINDNIFWMQFSGGRCSVRLEDLCEKPDYCTEKELKRALKACGLKFSGKRKVELLERLASYFDKVNKDLEEHITKKARHK